MQAKQQLKQQKQQAKQHCPTTTVATTILILSIRSSILCLQKTNAAVPHRLKWAPVSDWQEDTWPKIPWRPHPGHPEPQKILHRTTRVHIIKARKCHFSGVDFFFCVSSRRNAKKRPKFHTGAFWPKNLVAKTLCKKRFSKYAFRRDETLIFGIFSFFS